VVGGRDTLHFRERFTSKMVSCPETADHPDQALIMAVNRLDKPRKLTRTPPVTRRTLPVTPSEQCSSQIVTRRLMEVIRWTPVRNET
jgi:hypothetical protein